LVQKQIRESEKEREASISFLVSCVNAFPNLELKKRELRRGKGKWRKFD
jgi:hypothetical protein